jgi:hypothetical protein
MYEEIDAILKEILDFDLDALLASLNDPPIEVISKNLYKDTERLLKNLGET